MEKKHTILYHPLSEEGKGVSATSENYRVATAAELNQWKEYKKQQEQGV